MLGSLTTHPSSSKATFQLPSTQPGPGILSHVRAWPYADMYEDLKPHIVSNDYEDYNLVAPVVKPKAMTTDELMTQVIGCYRRFYMGKLKTVPSMSKFKRDYFVITMKLLMENSYLKQFMGGLGGMPKEVDSLLNTWL